MRRAQRRGVAAYLLVAFAGSWAVQIAYALLRRGNPLLPGPLGLGQALVFLLLMWPPALGAYVARRRVERSGFADAGQRRPALGWVLVAWLSPALLTLITLIVSLPFYPLDTELSAVRQALAAGGQQASPRVLVGVQILLALTVAVPFNAVFAFGEEFGWRGYLLPRLMTLLGPWSGTLVHGAIWGLWHAPLILLTGYNYPDHPVAGVPLFVISATLIGIWFAWLRVGSRSIWPPTIAHGALNAIAGLPLILLDHPDSAVAAVLFSPVGWSVLLVAIALLSATGRLDVIGRLSLPRLKALPDPRRR